MRFILFNMEFKIGKQKVIGDLRKLVKFIHQLESGDTSPPTVRKELPDFHFCCVSLVVEVGAEEWDSL